MKKLITSLFVLTALFVFPMAVQAQAPDLPGDGSPPVEEEPEIDPPELDLDELLQQFQEARENFIQQVQDLAGDIRDASDEEREAIREQIMDAIDDWRAAQVEFREAIEEQVAELRDNLQDDLPVDAGDEEGGRP